MLFCSSVVITWYSVVRRVDPDVPGAGRGDDDPWQGAELEAGVRAVGPSQGQAAGVGQPGPAHQPRLLLLTWQRGVNEQNTISNCYAITPKNH